MKLLRLILFPVVPIYYVITWYRNLCYDKGWKTSTSFEKPIICVGNLSVGGTGKTPTIEYLFRLLGKENKVAVLSRGYKRQSEGFVLADENASAASIGDEPFQFYKKFEDIIVAVDANRINGITQLLEKKNPDVILLDDAFQHRKVKAGFNVLLTAYDNLYCDDFVLPTGNLREPRYGAKRAQVIVVTKCPSELSAEEKTRIVKKLNPLKHQNVYFSSISYSEDVLGTHQKIAVNDLKEDVFTLVTGIANPKPLLKHLKGKGLQFEHIEYKDHHNFTEDDIKMLKSKTRIVTTEKDYVRLIEGFKNSEALFYLPIAFSIDKSEAFKAEIMQFVTSFD